MLLNARRRRRKSRRNPSKARSNKRFVKAYKKVLRKKGSGVRRARRLSIRRYRITGGRQGLVVRARKIYVSRRGRKAALIVARNPRRRSRSRRNPMIPSLGGITAQVKGLFSKENLTVAAGGVAATVVTQYALSLKKDGKSLLPFPTDPNMVKAATVAYAIGIPFVGALVTRRFSPGAAKGMLFGGLINGLLTAFRVYVPDVYGKVTGTGEYLDYMPTSAVGQLPPSYMAASRFSGTSPFNGSLDNSSAFPSDAWAAN